MKRRQFLQAAGLSLATAAVAQTNPAIKWRLTSSYPKSLHTVYGAGETITKFVTEATDNQFHNSGIRGRLNRSRPGYHSA